MVFALCVPLAAVHLSIALNDDRNRYTQVVVFVIDTPYYRLGISNEYENGHHAPTRGEFYTAMQRSHPADRVYTL